MKRKLNYFTNFEIALLLFSIFTIVLSFLIFDRKNFLILSASLIGATSLIFNAKANPIGQALMVVFSILYGIISYTFSYYGEMVTYLGMTAPMAIFSFISWIKNPYKGNKSQVKINKIKMKEIILMFLLSIMVTFSFFFILSFFNTTNIIPSTISVTTSFIAVYLTLRRSAWYAIAYLLNDLTLIVLWILATLESSTYLSVVICFFIFFLNDLYAFIHWKKIQKYQNNN